MTDFTKLPPRIVQLLTLVFSDSASDGERVNALRAFDRYLKRVDGDGHELIEWIQLTPVTDEEMQKVFDQGRELGRSEVVDQRQRAAAAVASLVNSNDANGHNGYSWREIVGHCLLNQHLIRNDWEANFVESVAEQLAHPYSTLTQKQTPIVRRIFQTWFRGNL